MIRRDVVTGGPHRGQSLGVVPGSGRPRSADCPASTAHAATSARKSTPLRRSEIIHHCGPFLVSLRKSIRRQAQPGIRQSSGISYKLSQNEPAKVDNARRLTTTFNQKM